MHSEHRIAFVAADQKLKLAIFVNIKKCLFNIDISYVPIVIFIQKYANK